MFNLLSPKTNKFKQDHQGNQRLGCTSPVSCIFPYLCSCSRPLLISSPPLYGTEVPPKNHTTGPPCLPPPGLPTFLGRTSDAQAAGCLPRLTFSSSWGYFRSSGCASERNGRGRGRHWVRKSSIDGRDLVTQIVEIWLDVRPWCFLV